jgi:hypothetical protein
VRIVVLVVALAVTLAAASPAAARGRQRGAAPAGAADREQLGPEMKAYMGYLDAEEAELKHLYDVGEVTPADFEVSHARLEAMRLASVRVARSRGDDVVPELDILLSSELKTVLPEGIAALRGKRAGDSIGDAWRYHGTIRVKLTFYVLERTNRIGRDTTY